MVEHQRSIAITLVGFCSYLNLYPPQPLLPLFTEVFHASKLAVSLTVSATTIAIALAAPWAGVVADRVGHKRLMVPALLMLTLPTLLAAIAPDLHGLIVCRFIQGLLMAIVFATGLTYVSEEWAGTGVGAAMALYITSNAVGGFAGRFLSGLIADALGWRWAFGILGGLTLLGGLVSRMWLPHARQVICKQSMGDSIRAMGAHLRNPHLLAAYAVGFNVLFCMTATFTYVNFYLSAAPFHLTTVGLGSVFCVYLFGVVVTPIAGRWIDRLGYRMSLLLAIALVCAGVMLTLIPVLWMVVIGLAITASGVFICQSVATSYVGTTAQSARSSATGLYLAAYYIGGSLGAIVPGLVWAIGQWYACVALVVGIQLATAYLVMRHWSLVICHTNRG